VRRLEEDHGAGFGGQPLQTAAALPRLAGQETLEAEPVDRQPADRQGGQHRRRPGHRGHGDAVVDRRSDQPVARVADRGHAGIGGHQHHLAGLQVRDQARDPRCLVAFEIADHRRVGGHAETQQQRPQQPGVLGCDHIGGTQRADQRRGRILGVPDGSTSEHEASLPGLKLGSTHACQGSGPTSPPWPGDRRN